MMHSRTECKHGVLITQCRCMHPNKTVITVACPDRCKQRETDLQARTDSIAQSMPDEFPVGFARYLAEEEEKTVTPEIEEFQRAVAKLEEWRDWPVPDSVQFAVAAAAKSDPSVAAGLWGIMTLSSEETIAALLPFLLRGLSVLDTSHGAAVSAVENELALARAINRKLA